MPTYNSLFFYKILASVIRLRITPSRRGTKNDFFQTHAPVMLDVGGLVKREGWVTVNSKDYYGTEVGYHVDVVREMYDLQGFPNNSVACVYASHILEHASFGDGMLAATLTEWHRVLHPGGLIMISVPNLETLSTMYLDKSLNFDQHWMITRMMYGAQVDEYDYHRIGFDESILATWLKMHKFCDMQRLRSFNLFSDTSDMVYAGYEISLNVVARPCRDSEPEVPIEDDFRIDHHGTPFYSTQR
jgi:predicted SAM-dependent methyltransferase